jgi:hypothetical protein
VKILDLVVARGQAHSWTERQTMSLDLVDPSPATKREASLGSQLQKMNLRYEAALMVT